MPLFQETDAPLLKTFLIRRLNSASEADPDVLSDYILALLRHDQSPEEVMQTCITQLADFMTSGNLSLFPKKLCTNNHLRSRSFRQGPFSSFKCTPLHLLQTDPSQNLTYRHQSKAENVQQSPLQHLLTQTKFLDNPIHNQYIPTLYPQPQVSHGREFLPVERQHLGQVKVSHHQAGTQQVPCSLCSPSDYPCMDKHPG